MTPDAPLARGLGFWQAIPVNIAQIVGAVVFFVRAKVRREWPFAESQRTLRVN